MSRGGVEDRPGMGEDKHETDICDAEIEYGTKPVHFSANAIDFAPPTIDAVLVVRCENCKYGYPCGDEIVCYHPEYELAEGKWSYKKDFFCAFGDTKEGE